MEQTITNENQDFEPEQSEPALAENSYVQSEESEKTDSHSVNGQSDNSDPSQEKILGKFNSVEDLSKAYEELQKHQGKNSEELGSLRKELAKFEELKNASSFVQSYHDSIIPVIKRDRELYPEYFEDQTFKEMYSEALMAYGDNLDTDRMISMLETYVKSRIEAYDKQRAGMDETQKVLDAMSYSKNPKNSIMKPAKTLDEMTDEEFRESVRKLI